MALGANRDYKTTDRTTRKNLLRHGHIMADLVLDGMERCDASALAFKMLKDKSLFERVYAERLKHRKEMKAILNLSSYGRD